MSTILRFPQSPLEKLPMAEWSPDVKHTRGIQVSAYLNRPLGVREIQNMLWSLEAIPEERRAETWPITYEKYSRLMEQYWLAEQTANKANSEVARLVKTGTGDVLSFSTDSSDAALSEVTDDSIVTKGAISKGKSTRIRGIIPTWSIYQHRGRRNIGRENA